MPNIIQRAVAAAFGRPAAKPQPNGAIVRGRTEAEALADKPVNGNHRFYGNGVDQASAFRAAAANRALVENTLRKEHDPNWKSHRVTCADEQF